MLSLWAASHPGPGDQPWSATSLTIEAHKRAGGPEEILVKLGMYLSSPKSRILICNTTMAGSIYHSATNEGGDEHNKRTAATVGDCMARISLTPAIQNVSRRGTA